MRCEKGNKNNAERFFAILSVVLVAIHAPFGGYYFPTCAVFMKKGQVSLFRK